MRLRHSVKERDVPQQHKEAGLMLGCGHSGDVPSAKIVRDPTWICLFLVI